MKALEKVNYKGFIWPLIVGIVLWCITPWRPSGLTPQAWQMFAIFVATIVGCITKPLPIGGTTLTGLVVTVLVGLAPMKDVTNAKGMVVNQGVLSSFGNSAAWLIAMAFIMAHGISKTGLGNRIAYIMIQKFGKKSLGIGYAITGLELVLGALIPSNSARTGGVVWPVVQSVSKEGYDSKPDEASRKKIGAYIDFTAFHANILSTALFITGAAPNMVAQQLAAQKGYQMSWAGWFFTAIVPVAVGAIIVPWVIYKMYPPEIKETPDAKKWLMLNCKQWSNVCTRKDYVSCLCIVYCALGFIWFLQDSTIRCDFCCLLSCHYFNGNWRFNYARCLERNRCLEHFDLAFNSDVYGW